MDTTIKVTLYLNSLQARLTELKTDAQALAAYKVDLVKWRQSLADWLTENAKARIDAITVNELKEKQHRNYRLSDPHFLTDNFFRGCPDAPSYPDDKQIRDITALLRHLSITGQETVKVSTSDVERYLGDFGKIDD